MNNKNLTANVGSSLRSLNNRLFGSRAKKPVAQKKTDIATKMPISDETPKQYNQGFNSYSSRLKEALNY